MMPASREPARRLWWFLLAGVPTVFFGVFFLYPVFTVLVEGLSGPTTVGDVMGRSSVHKVLWFTVAQATASTLLTLAVGLPGAAMVARMTGPGRRLVRALVTVPFVLPTVVVGAAFEGVFERFGLAYGGFRLRHTIWAILLAHMFFNYAVVVRTVGAWWAGLDARQEDAARVLGGRPWQVFAQITWPRLKPAVLGAGIIVFLFSLTSFGVILVLGGPGRATIETEIHRYAIVRLDLETAAALALLQLVAVALLVLLTTSMERRRVLPQRLARAAAPRRRWSLTAVNTLVMTLLLALPIGVLVERSLATNGTYSLSHYRALGDRVPFLAAPATSALWNSIVFATLAATIAVIIGGCASVVAVRGQAILARVLDVGLTLPLGTSAVTLGLGILLALDGPPLDFRSAWWIVPVAHALVGIPFVVRTVVPALRAVDHRLREVAAVLGATPGQIRREVDWPMASRAGAVGAAFAFTVSLGEFGATSFLPRGPDTLTAPLALFRLLSTPGELLRGQAMALSVVLMALTVTAVVLIESLRRHEGGML